MQFLVKAMDYSDAEAIDRRMQHRDKHLAGVREMIASGSFLSGGAILNNEGKMIGSTLHLKFESREALQNHLDSDPYIAGKVWENIEINEVKLVPTS